MAKNILIERRWYAQVKAAANLVEIAKQHNTTRSCVQVMINLAFLSPEVLDRIATGSHPIGLTSQWVKHHFIPSDWREQQDLFQNI